MIDRLSTIPLVDELGAMVESRWRAANYDEHRFAELCTNALREFSMPDRISPWEMTDWALRQVRLPTQQDLPGRFGDPPITLWASNRFHIDVYFWMNGTTSIHQHAFAGAFQVLLGGSVHSEYSFQPSIAINRSMEVGDLSLKSVELLQVSDTRPILHGRRFIHSLFHMENPSATLVIRTFHAMLEPPQFDYKKPFLATDPFFAEPGLTKQLQIIGLLYRARRANVDDQVAEMLSNADFQSTFAILSSVRQLLRPNAAAQQFGLDEGAERMAGFYDIARRKHGEVADRIPPVFAHADTVSELTGLRSLIADPEHRFFLALLLNVEERTHVLRLIQDRYPAVDPIDKVLDWITDLGFSRVGIGTKANVLGIDAFSDADVALLEGMLREDGPPTSGTSERVTALRSSPIISRLLG